jgi:hypothetical protein
VWYCHPSEVVAYSLVPKLVQWAGTTLGDAPALNVRSHKGHLSTSLVRFAKSPHPAEQLSLQLKAIRLVPGVPRVGAVTRQG